MFNLLSIEETENCADTIKQLRMEVYNLNEDILILDTRLADKLSPSSYMNHWGYYAMRRLVVRKRDFCANLIKDIREVLVEPPSLESRVFGYVVRYISLGYI